MLSATALVETNAYTNPIRGNAHIILFLTESLSMPASPLTKTLLTFTTLALLISACRRARNDNDGNRGNATAKSTPNTALLYQSPDTYEVGVFEGYVVHDATRDRDIPIKLRYPKDAPGPLPLIVFSHGGGANNKGQNAYGEWGETLAAAGYAVINLAHVEDEHDAHCAPLGIPSTECEPGDFRTEVAAGGTLPALWYNRPRDASAVLDDLAGIEKASGLDLAETQMGMAGHSAGAHTVMSLAGAVVAFAPSVPALTAADPRFKAFLALSPQGVDYVGMTEDSWGGITAPLLVVTGAGDKTPGEQAGDRTDAFAHSNPPDKYLVFIDSPQATHSTFGLGPDGTARLMPYIKAPAVAFFDAYVRGLSEAKSWLDSTALSEASAGVARVEGK